MEPPVSVERAPRYIFCSTISRLTIDEGFEYEHDLKKLRFGIIVVETINNHSTPTIIHPRPSSR
jgi:hypothetical protein